MRSALPSLCVLLLLFAAERAHAQSKDPPARYLSPGVAGVLWRAAQLVPSPVLVTGSSGVGGVRWQVPIHFDTFINSDDRPGDCGRELQRVERVRKLDPARVALLAIGEQRVLVSRSR